MTVGSSVKDSLSFPIMTSLLLLFFGISCGIALRVVDNEDTPKPLVQTWPESESVVDETQFQHPEGPEDSEDSGDSGPGPEDSEHSEDSQDFEDSGDSGPPIATATAVATATAGPNETQ